MTLLLPSPLGFQTTLNPKASVRLNVVNGTGANETLQSGVPGDDTVYGTAGMTLSLVTLVVTSFMAAQAMTK